MFCVALSARNAVRVEVEDFRAQSAPTAGGKPVGQIRSLTRWLATEYSVTVHQTKNTTLLGGVFVLRGALGERGCGFSVPPSPRGRHFSGRRGRRPLHFRIGVHGAGGYGIRPYIIPNAKSTPNGVLFALYRTSTVWDTEISTSLMRTVSVAVPA